MKKPPFIYTALPPIDNEDEKIEFIEKLEENKKNSKNGEICSRNFISSLHSKSQYELSSLSQKSNDSHILSLDISTDYSENCRNSIWSNFVSLFQANSHSTVSNIFFKVFLGISGWFTSSISLTIINKNLFDKTRFNYPLLVTLFHFILTSLYLNWGLKVLGFPIKSTPNTKNIYIKFLIPISFFGVFDIAMTNISYHLLSLSAITVIKSCGIIFIYLFSIIFGLEDFRWSLLINIIFILSSIFFAVPNLEIKNYWGVTFVTLAVIAGSLRWIMVHYLLQIYYLSPIQLMSVTQPIGAIFLVLPTILKEFSIFEYSITKEEAFTFIFFITLMIFGSSFIALILVLSEYYIVGITSSLTLSFTGIAKEIFTILLSVVLFNEKISFSSLVAISFSIVGILVYTILRLAYSKQTNSIISQNKNLIASLNSNDSNYSV